MSVRLLARHPAIAFALALAATAATARPAAADEPGLTNGAPPPGSYEGVALAGALAARGLTVDPAPAGKRVGRIHVVNLDVFGAEEAWLRWANIFHRTTREHIIAREVLLEPGEIWDETRIDETRRRLREPLFTTLVVVVPVVSAEPGAVDVLVVTRDVWSLRFNTRYELQGRALSELSVSLSENNLFGFRKQVAFVFDMDLGAYALGPQYVDPNIGGTRLQLIGKASAIFSRATGAHEGTRSNVSLAYPLWSLDREWGGAIQLSHYDATVRQFFGPEVYRWDDPATEEVEAVPVEYGLRTLGLETSATRQLGTAVKHRLTAGHDLGVVRPRFLDDAPGDPAVREAFAEQVMPRSERRSSLFARYAMFTPRYVVYRDIDSYDLAEDARLGPELTTEIGVAREAFGSERDFVRAALGGAWTFDLGDGFARGSFGLSARREAGAVIDRYGSTTFTLAAPTVRGVRLVARANVAARVDSVSNQPFYVGGLTGLRGYPIDVFRGERQVIANLEVRSAPLRVLFTRAGLVAFWDAGHAAATFGALSLHHDVGVGARLLIPQLQPYVFRFDWAVPLHGPSAGFPGRFTSGVQQVF